MKLQTSVQHDVTVISLTGELTADSVPKFSEAVAASFSAQRRDFVVDLKHVGSIDSAGLEAFTALQRQCDEQLGMVRFCGADHNVSKILEMTRLDKQLSLHADSEKALGSFVGSSN